MQIFNTEVNDGLRQVMENKSIAFECPIIKSTQENDNVSPESIEKVLASAEDVKQSDLYYLNSVLVSAGWNKNDDVFSPEILWSARNTPVDKQFNYMHDETDIIGHITKALVMDQHGNIIDDSTAEENLPDKIDIITSAVVYKTWSDPEMRGRIDELTSGIDDGQWSVSMECVFNDFDYAIVAPDGENKVLARTEDSAFLTKHLRAYGGKGEYEGYKVGRLLKGIYFSGKGLVNNPANPRSIIFSKDINPFNSKANISFTNFLTAMEVNDMTDAVNEQVAQLQQNLEAAQAELEAAKTDLQKENEEALASHESAIAEKDQIIASLETKVKELEDAVAKMDEDKKKTEEENEKMKKGMKNMKRKAALTQAGADDERAEELLSKFENASDEMFESVIALVESKPSPAPKPEPEPEPEAEAEVEVDEDEADASVLDEAEEQEPVSLAINDAIDEVETAMSKGCEWLRESVLQSTRNLNK